MWARPARYAPFLLARKHFQSTRPVWARREVEVKVIKDSDFNPRAPCGRDISARTTSRAQSDFNPRARVGRDDVGLYPEPILQISSTRPVGRDLGFFQTPSSMALFQSTRPVWGATGMELTGLGHIIFQSTRPVWGATNSHVPAHRTKGFQSTRPVWGATIIWSKKSRF